MKRRYTNLDGQIIGDNAFGAARRFVSDVLGSNIALLNESSEVLGQLSYWPYGEQNLSIGETSTPFQFGGSWGLYVDTPDRHYVRARNLNSHLGGWSSPDMYYPSEPPYAYAQSNPTSLIDPNGTKPAPPNGPPYNGKSHCDRPIGTQWKTNECAVWHGCAGCEQLCNAMKNQPKGKAIDVQEDWVLECCGTMKGLKLPKNVPIPMPGIPGLPTLPADDIACTAVVCLALKRRKVNCELDIKCE